MGNGFGSFPDAATQGNTSSKPNIQRPIKVSFPSPPGVTHLARFDRRINGAAP